MGGRAIKNQINTTLPLAASWYWPCKQSSESIFQSGCDSVASQLFFKCCWEYLWSFYCCSALQLWIVFGLSNELHTQRLNDWWRDRLAGTCIWERNIGAFIYCQQQLNEAEHQTFAPSQLIPPSGPQRDGELAEDMTLLCILWRVSGAVIFPFSYTLFLPLSHRSIFLLGYLRQSGGVDWCPFRLLDLSFPFSSTQVLRIHFPGLQLTSSHCHQSSALLLPFPLQSLSLIAHSIAFFSLCLSFSPRIFLSHSCVIFHVLPSRNAQGPLSHNELWHRDS